jgi:hypothetical protein
MISRDVPLYEGVARPHLLFHSKGNLLQQGYVCSRNNMAAEAFKGEQNRGQVAAFTQRQCSPFDSPGKLKLWERLWARSVKLRGLQGCKNWRP